MNVIIDIGFYIAYALLGITVLATIIFPVRYLIKYPRESKYSMISIGIMAFILLIGYLISGGEIPAIFEKYKIGSSQFKLVGGGLITVYILTIAAIIAVVYTEIKSLIK